MITTSMFPYCTGQEKTEIADELAKATFFAAGTNEVPIRTTSDGSGMGTQDRTVSVNPAHAVIMNMNRFREDLSPAGRAWVIGYPVMM